MSIWRKEVPYSVSIAILVAMILLLLILYSIFGDLEYDGVGS